MKGRVQWDDLLFHIEPNRKTGTSQGKQPTVFLLRVTALGVVADMAGQGLLPQLN